VTSPQEAVCLGIEVAYRRKHRSQRADRFERLGRAALEALIALGRPAPASGGGLLRRAADGVDGAAAPSARGPGVGHTSTFF
jgi:hypothetical protein